MDYPPGADFCMFTHTKIGVFKAKIQNFKGLSLDTIPADSYRRPKGRTILGHKNTNITVQKVAERCSTKDD